MKHPDRFSHQRMLDRDDKRHHASFWSVRSSEGVVATAHYLATAAGVEMLQRGGNAIDAAVAASLVLGVCESAGSGLGGMAMTLVRLARDGRVFAVPGACLAPRRAVAEEVARSPRYRGYRAVAVPRHLAVLHHLLSRYGTLKPSEVLGPAIEIAEAGFPLSRLQHGIIDEYREPLRNSTAAPLFLDARGDPLPPGWPFRQPALGRTLERLAAVGLEDFYRGEIAREICRDMEIHGGFIEPRDLKAALEVPESIPLSGRFHGNEFLTLGPPGGGLALVQMLQMASDLGELDLNRIEDVVLAAAIIRRARRDRRSYSVRITVNDVGGARELLDLDYARRAAEEIMEELSRAASPDSAVARGDRRAGETSHISVMDRAGNVVALTQSIERNFGAAVVTPSLGFVYNGYLRALKVLNRHHPHYLRPGAPARSNAAPTIAFEDAKPWVALGNTGAERMCSGIFEVLLRLRHQEPFDAVQAPRLHCTPEGHVLLEEARFPEGCRAALLRHGFTVEALEPYSFMTGGLQLVVRHGDEICGVGDPRRDGAAGAPE